MYQISVSDDFSEKINYNNPLFPAYCRFGALSAFPDYTAIGHWHTDLEFILVTEGTLEYRVDGEPVVIHQGEGLFVNSRRLHFGYSSRHEESCFWCILLSPDLLQANSWFYLNYVQPLLQGNMNYHLFLPQTPEELSLLALLWEIVDAHDKKEAPFVIQRNFLSICEILRQMAGKNKALPVREENDARKKLLLQMTGYIQQHYTEPITLQMIAESASCSKSTCQKLFRIYLFESPVRYLNDYRLHKSLDLLLSKDISITEVALECGFLGSSYFCEVFRKKFGITPKEYSSSRL